MSYANVLTSSGLISNREASLNIQAPPERSKNLEAVLVEAELQTQRGHLMEGRCGS